MKWSMIPKAWMWVDKLVTLFQSLDNSNMILTIRLTSVAKRRRPPTKYFAQSSPLAEDSMKVRKNRRTNVGDPVWRCKKSNRAVPTFEKS